MKKEEEQGFPGYDLDKLIKEAKRHLTEEQKTTTRLDIYHAVSKMRSRELRRIRKHGKR